MLITDYRDKVEDVYVLELPQDLAIKGVDIRQIYIELYAEPALLDAEAKPPVPPYNPPIGPFDVPGPFS